MSNVHEQELSRIIRIMEALSMKDDARKLAKDFEIAQCDSRIEALMKHGVSEEKWRECVNMMESAVEVMKEITSAFPIEQQK